MSGIVVTFGPATPEYGPVAMSAPVSGGGAVAEVAQPQAADVFERLTTIISQLIASMAAEQGAQLVQGGGAAAPGPTSGGSFLETIASTAYIGGSDGGISTQAVEVRNEAPVTGGGVVAPSVDMRRVVGTPQPGGVIDLLLQRASTVAAPATSGGSWIEVADGAGARMQVHVHGAWASQPHRIAEAVMGGALAVHLHEDGTVHLHDVA